MHDAKKRPEMNLIPFPEEKYQEFYHDLCVNIIPCRKGKEKMTEYNNEALVDAFQHTKNRAEQKQYLTELYQDNYLYFWKICKRYSAYENIDDLMQESFFGLRIAVERYDPDQGVPFIKYAAIWIEQTISAYIESCGHVVRFPRWMNSRIIKYEKARKRFYQENKREPSDQELADILNLTVKQLNKVKTNALVMDVKSLDKIISAEDDDLSLIDVIPDPIDHYEEITDQMDEDIKRQTIREEVDQLKDNEAQIIKEYYFNEKTLEDIGRNRGCTKERVRQIRNRGLSKLKSSVRLQRYADDYMSARAYTGTGINTFKYTGTSATERTAIEHIDKVIQSHVRETDRQIRRIEKKYGITLDQFRHNMTDRIIKDMNV